MQQIHILSLSVLSVWRRQFKFVLVKEHNSTSAGFKVPDIVLIGPVEKLRPEKLIS